MRNDIRLCYEQLLNESHSGHPSVLERVSTGSRGRPRIVIDPEFLRFANQHRSTAAIARFLGVGTTTVRTALLQYGIASPGENPFQPTNNPQLELPENHDIPPDDLLDPQLPIPHNFSAELHRLPTQTSSNISEIDDEALDTLIIRLQMHYRRAGITMMEGMLQRLGHRIPRERIRSALLRIDPIRRVFERIRIRRRVYSVPGPNSLWHHDGQHGEYYFK